MSNRNDQLANLAADIETLNRLVAVPISTTGRFNVVRAVPRQRSSDGAYVWRAIERIDSGLSREEVAKQYPDASFDIEIGRACHWLAMASLDSVEGRLTPDSRPNEVLPEDYYAL